MNYVRDPIAEVAAGFVEMASWLWWLSIMFFGIGDLMTTGAAVLFTPVAEGSPVVGWMFDAYGLGGLVLLKLLAFGVAVAAWRTIQDPHNVGVPLTLSVLGIGLTTWNLFVLASAASG
jgi:cation transporter-like permease